MQTMHTANTRCKRLLTFVYVYVADCRFEGGQILRTVQPALDSSALQKIGSELMNRWGSGLSMYGVNPVQHGSRYLSTVHPFCQLDLSLGYLRRHLDLGLTFEFFVFFGYALLYDDSALVLPIVAGQFSYQGT